MTRSQIPQLRELFDACVDLPVTDQQAWIDAQVSDPALRNQLRTLIAADRKDITLIHYGGLVEQQLQSTFPPSADSGDIFVGRKYGHFRLTQLLGRGGQGLVFRAQREDADFRQEVAVKLISRVLDDDQRLRLIRERQILASFQHSGVARLIDAGVGDDGTPFLAMELIEGQQIIHWCVQQKLTSTSRLVLFAELCGIVAAAHHMLIVHRDLKPENVFVDQQSKIKVLDFGIARLLSDTDDATQFPMYTPGYSAPEQQHQGLMSTACDVYSLGVILRELLTGVSPRPPKAATDSTLNSVPNPTANTSSNRTTQVLLAEELKWMISKATAEDPDDRYPDAASLGTDVQAFLDGQPISAHPPSTWYRTRKFVSRHRGSVALTVLLSLGMVVSLVLALLQSVRATQAAKIATEQSKRAEVVRDFLIDVMSAAADDLPRDQRPTPAQLAAKAQSRLLTDSKVASDVRLDLLLTFAEINLSQREFSALLENLEQAELLLVDGLSDAKLRWLRLDAERLIANGQAAQAAALLQPFKGEMIALDSEQSMETLQALAWAQTEQGQNAEALQLEELITERFDKLLGPEHASTLKSRMDLGLSYTNLGRWADADRTLTALFAKWQELKLPQDAEFAEAMAGLGYAKLFQAKFDEAQAVFEQTLALRRKIYTAPHDRIAHSLSAVSQVELLTGKYQQAVQHRAEALSMELEILKVGHPELIATRAQLANSQISLGVLDQAQATLAPAVTACELAKDSPQYCEMLNSIRTRLLLEQGNLTQAKASALKGVALSTNVHGENGTRLAEPYGLLASTYAALGSEADARTAMAKALRLTGGNGMTWQKLRVMNVRVLEKFQRDAEVLQETTDLLITRPEQVPNPHDQSQLWILRIEALKRLNLKDGLPVARANLAKIEAPFLQASWQARRAQALELPSR
jgi:eukaryotic-like serine/threonine-protein kinase